jgi:hypothetical protein
MSPFARVGWWKSAKVAWLEAQLVLLEDRVQRASIERDYWKSKAEQLLDMALFKRGEITAPVFEERKVVADRNPMLTVLGAMNTMEIDSSKKRPASTAAPVTPMP